MVSLCFMIILDRPLLLFSLQVILFVVPFLSCLHLLMLPHGGLSPWFFIVSSCLTWDFICTHVPCTMYLGLNIFFLCGNCTIFLARIPGALIFQLRLSQHRDDTNLDLHIFTRYKVIIFIFINNFFFSSKKQVYKQSFIQCLTKSKNFSSPFH